MKTLKKTLCLVLAVVMAVGVLVLPASAADETTVDVTKYNEAVAVTNGLGILKGDDNGDLLLDKEVTRAEAITLIARLALTPDVADKYPEGDFSFTDCEGYPWAKSAIAYGEDEGIVAGVGSGKFEPGRSVTGLELAKMILCAAGYNAETEGMTGDSWEGKTQTLARKVGLGGNLDSLNAKTPLVRAQVAQMIYNGLKVELVDYKSNGSVSAGDVSVNFGTEVDPLGETFAAQFGLEKTGSVDSEKTHTGALNIVEGVITSNSAVAKTDKTMIGGTDRNVNTGADLYHHYVKLYVDKNGKVIAGPFDLSTVVVVDKKISGDDYTKKFGNATTATTVEGLNTNSPEIDTAKKTAEAGTFFLYDGKVQAYTKPTTYYATSVTRISKDGDITLNAGPSGAVKKDSYTAYEGIAVKDVVIAYSVNNNATIWTIDKAETVEGNVSRIESNNKYTVGGAKLEPTALASTNVNTASSLGLKKTNELINEFKNVYKFYLDKDGKYFAYEQVTDEETESTVYYLVATYNITELDDYGIPDTTTYAQVIDLDGNVQTFTVKDETTNNKNSNKGKFVTLAYNTTDKVYEISPVSKTAATMETSDDYGTATVSSNKVVDSSKSRIDSTSIQENKAVYLNSDTVYVFVYNELGKLDKNVATSVKETLTSDASVIGHLDSDNNFVADMIVFAKKYNPSETSAEYYYVTSAEPAQVADGFEYTVYDTTTGETTTIVVAHMAAEAPGFFTYTTDGDGVNEFNTKADEGDTIKYDAVYSGRVGTKIRAGSKLDDAEAADAVIVDLRAAKTNGNYMGKDDVPEIATLDDIHDLYVDDDGAETDDVPYTVTMDVKLDKDGNVVIIFVKSVAKAN